MKFTAKVLVFFIICLTAYTIFIECLPFKPIYSQSLEDANRIQAEGFLFMPSTPEAVILGSSLTARLPHEQLLPEIYNLAMRGKSALTGLEILAKSEHKPKVVFIETNTIDIGVDLDMIDSLFSPMSKSLKYIFPSLRTRFAPVNIFNSALIELNSLAKTKKNKTEKINFNVDQKVFLQLLRIKQDSMAKLPETKSLATNISKIKEFTEILKQGGSQIIFVEMPIHSTLINSKRQEAIRTAMQESFPIDQYHWLIFPPDEQFKTTDGIHLDGQGIQIVASFMLSELQKYSNVTNFN